MAGRTARSQRSRTTPGTPSRRPGPARREWPACSQRAARQLAHGVVHGARGEGHVGERGIHARRAGHAGAVRDEQVRHVVRLVVGVQHRRLAIAAHARRPHLVHAEPRRPVVVVRLDVLASRRREHLGCLGLYVLADGPLVRTPRAVDPQQRDPPLVRALRVQVHVVLVTGQAFAVALHGDPPRPGLAQLLLQLGAEAWLRRAANPPLPARPRLNPVAAHEADLAVGLRAEVAEARDVRARGPPAVGVLVLEAGHDAARARLGDVVHEVMAHFAARVGEPRREAPAPRVEQDLGGADGGRAQKDEPARVLARLLRVRIDHADTRRPVRALVVGHAVDDRVGHHRQFPRGPRRGQRRAQAREVAPVAATARALVAGLAWAAAVVRLRQVCDAGHRQVAPRKRALDPLAHVALGAGHLPGREKLAVRQVREPEPLPAHADEALDVAVPRLQLAIPDRPVDAVAVAQVGLEIEVAPAPAESAPDEAAPAELVAADPAERLVVRRGVGVLPIVHEEVPRRLAERVVLALDRVVALVLILIAPPPVRELPRLEPLGDVVLAVLYVPAALYAQRAQALLAQLLRGPAARDPRADDDRVVGFVALRDHTAHARPICASGTHPSKRPGTATWCSSRVAPISEV